MWKNTHDVRNLCNPLDDGESKNNENIKHHQHYLEVSRHHTRRR